MITFFTDFDGADEPTIFEATDGDPAVVVRRAELPGPRADLLWRVLTGVLCADDEETVERVARAMCERPAFAFQPPCSTHRADARAALAALRDAE